MSAPNRDLHRYLDHFCARVLQDALNQATATYWEQRALALENARPRPGDRPGIHTTPAALRARHRALTEDAAACRDLAAQAPLQTAPSPDVWAALTDADHQTGHDLPDAA